ncbi:hypothetical protein LLG95_17290, partial [bacterium]|nr:hypothetical protein [bacterium]
MMMVTIHHPPFTTHFFRWFILCLLMCIPAGAIASTVDRDAADLMRASLAGRPIPQSGSLDLIEWKAFASALSIASTDEREQALRDIYKKTDSIYLRSVILEAISEDPQFRSRQAQFIRRYGFYANWFNRLMITFTDTLQGRIQAVGQLVVDAANDLIRPAEADPLERRAYELALQSESTNSPSARAQMQTLRKRVDRTRAADDLERAQWALEQDDPESAEFYASQALVERPGWGSAEKLRLKAAEKAAENNRRALASTQVGYPDRNPPVRPADADLARSVLVSQSLAPNDSADKKLATELTALLPSAPDRGRARMMREWQGAI